MAHGAIDRCSEGRAAERGAQSVGARDKHGRCGGLVVSPVRALATSSVPYLQEAQAIGHAVPLVAPSVPITIKMPANVVRDVRAYAVLSGLTISEIVTRAITAFIAAVRGHG